MRIILLFALIMGISTAQADTITTGVINVQGTNLTFTMLDSGSFSSIWDTEGNATNGFTLGTAASPPYFWGNFTGAAAARDAIIDFYNNGGFHDWDGTFDGFFIPYVANDATSINATADNDRTTGGDNHNQGGIPDDYLYNPASGYAWVVFTPFTSSIDSTAAVTDSNSAMYTINDVYNRLNTGMAGSKRSGAFTEPAGVPASSSKDLNDLMGIAPAIDDSNGATATEVTRDKTFWSLRSDGSWGTTTGNLATQTLSNTSETFNAGIYTATTLSSVDTDLQSSNIKTGVTIFGIAGNATTSGTTYSAGVAKTGLITCYNTTGNLIACAGTGQDGDLQRGVAHASPRFTKNVNTANDNGAGGGTASDGICNGSETCNGTITDNSTGLIWLTKANCIATDNAAFDTDNTNGDGNVTWQHALDFIAGINNGTYNCSDISNSSSHQTDWRLPTVRELQSLINYNYNNPALSNAAATAKWSEGDPFSSVDSIREYWSSTTIMSNTNQAFSVSINSGDNIDGSKVKGYNVWPVRGGQ